MSPDQERTDPEEPVPSLTAKPTVHVPKTTAGVAAVRAAHREHGWPWRSDPECSFCMRHDYPIAHRVRSRFADRKADYRYYRWKWQVDARLRRITADQRQVVALQLCNKMIDGSWHLFFEVGD